MTAVKIFTHDNYEITATSFVPAHPIHHTLIINSATGVKQRYYFSFAEYMAEHGYTVYTYDYRGIGASRSASLTGFQATVMTWAERDYPAVVKHVMEEHPGNKISIIGHSIGGQLIGMAEASRQADSFIMVGSQTPYWRNYRGTTKIKIWLLWYLLIPSFTNLFGYFPSKKLGLFEDIPGPAARQWARWGKSINYLFDEFPEKRKTFSILIQPALVYSFSDDPFASPEAVDDLIQFYTSLKLERRHVHPSDIGLKSMGHFFFFRKSAKDIFWTEVIQWLRKQKA